MIFTELDVPDVFLVAPKKFSDNRGYFMETFKKNVFCRGTNQNVEFVQDNHSFSEIAHTIRGLHFQRPPFAQGKLVRCTRGKIIDVAVDIRTNSRTFMKHVSVELSSENAQQLWIPPGFLHGFATLTPNTEVQYKCTDYYDQSSDGNVLWNDPAFNVDWGIPLNKISISEKDKMAPTFSSIKSPF